MDEHLELAAKVRPHDVVRAGMLESLAGEHLDEVLRIDRRSLRRRFDAGTAFALLLMLVPGVVGIVLALDWDSSWRWVAMALAVLWILVMLLGGAQQLFIEREVERD